MALELDSLKKAVGALERSLRGAGELFVGEADLVETLRAGVVRNFEVRAFGSRIKQTAKKWSDLDLAVVGSAKMERNALYDLKEAFEESVLSIQVDVLDWYAISPEFQAVINEDYEVVHEPA